MKKRYQNKPDKESIFMHPFHHRKNMLNLFILSDLFVFLSTICWMEFSQSIFAESHHLVNVLYQISPLSLFTHNCDSYYTYIWILLFNLSTFVAMSIVILCIYCCHQTSFEPTCIVFLILTLVAFITISTFPIIAFIAFFKLSIFVLATLVQSNMNLIPAVYSNNVYFPFHDNLNNPHSDIFYQTLFKWIYQTPNKHYTSDWNIIQTLFTTLLVPIFAFIDCEKIQSPQNKIKDRKNISQHFEEDYDEYQLRIGVANKVLAKHYSSSFWIPFHSKYIAQKLLKTSYKECTINTIRELRGYPIKNVIESIRQSFKWKFSIWCNDEDNSDDIMSFYDKIIEVQYMTVLFVFIPLQTIFGAYGLIYPYLVFYQIITDLHGYFSIPNYIVDNEGIKLLLVSTLSSSQSVFRSLYLLSTHWYFDIFVICLIAHFISICIIIYKLWKLRYVFEMCLNVMIIQDNSILNENLVHKMDQLLLNIQATKVRNNCLEDLFGRYHLDKLIIEYAGNIHECKEHLD
eukprot:451116_1